MSRHAYPRRRLAAAVAAVLLVGTAAAGLGAVSLAGAAPVGTQAAGAATCTTSSSGYCTVPHDLGAVPSAVLVTMQTPYLGQASVDQLTAATFRLRVMRPYQDRAFAGLVGFYWQAVTGPPATTPAPTTTEPAPTTPAPTTTAPAARWPGPGNTGVPAGTTLTPYDGPCTITTAGTTLDAVDATGRCLAIVIRAVGVSFTRSKLPRLEQTDWTQTANWAWTVSDSDVDGMTFSDGALWGYGFTATRVDVVGAQHSVHCADRCTITDSWLHDQYNPAGGSYHNNAFITNGGADMVVRHNTLHCTPLLNSTDGGCTADVSLFGDFEAVTRVTVEGNLLKANNSSISYCAYGGYQPTKTYPVSTYIVFKDNVFERGPNGKCGVYGPVTSFQSSATGNEWTNNTWDDGTALVP